MKVNDYVLNEQLQNRIRQTPMYFEPASQNFASTTFKFKVVSSTGGISPEYTATLRKLPAAPSGLTAVAGNRHLKLTWDSPNDPLIIKYQYRRSTGFAYTPWADIPGSGPDTTSFTVGGLGDFLDPTKRYYVRIRAVNALGTGTFAQVDGRPNSAAAARPSMVTAVGGDRQVMVTWSDPQDPFRSRLFDEMEEVFGFLGDRGAENM